MTKPEWGTTKSNSEEEPCWTESDAYDPEDMPTEPEHSGDIAMGVMDSSNTVHMDGNFKPSN